jgi:hypothetical protein
VDSQDGADPQRGAHPFGEEPTGTPAERTGYAAESRRARKTRSLMPAILRASSVDLKCASCTVGLRLGLAAWKRHSGPPETSADRVRECFGTAATRVSNFRFFPRPDGQSRTICGSPPDFLQVREEARRCIDHRGGVNRPEGLTSSEKGHRMEASRPNSHTLSRLSSPGRTEL